MNKKISHVFSFIILSFLSIFPFIASAACTSGQICNPFKGGDTLPELIDAVLNNVIMPIAAVASVVYIIWAGFKYVLAQGKPAEIEKATDNLKYALIGVGILLGAAGISKVMVATVNSLIK